MGLVKYFIKLILNGSTMLVVAVIHNISGWNVTHAFPDQDYCRHESLPVPLLLHNKFTSFLVLYDADNVKSGFQKDTKGSHTTLLQWSLNLTFGMLICFNMLLDAEGRSFALLPPSLIYKWCFARHYTQRQFESQKNCTWNTAKLPSLNSAHYFSKMTYWTCSLQNLCLHMHRRRCILII